LITVISFLGVLIPLETNIQDRMGLYASGILTLTSFKYGISDKLPSVPYATMFDQVMLYQFATLVLCAGESMLVFRMVKGGAFFNENTIKVSDMDVLRNAETAFFLVLLALWVLYWLWIAGKDLGLKYCKKQHDWLYILCNQEYQAENDEIEDLEHKKDRGKIGELTDTLAEVFKKINGIRTEIAVAAEKKTDSGRVDQLQLQLKQLQDERATKEQELTLHLNDTAPMMQEDDKSPKRRPQSQSPRHQMATL